MLNLQPKKIYFEELRWPLIYTIDSDNEFIMLPVYPLDFCQIHEKRIKMSTKATRINVSTHFQTLR